MNGAAGNSPVEERYVILGTAGHIDHGKTTLVRALTGVDTDRLPEERRRGMTIELGFAPLTVGDVRFGVVDVPGHERFVRTMVAGATGIDVVLLIVATDDSVMPQTVEHVQILALLGVPEMVVALTKIDAVSEDLVELVEEEVRSLLSGTPYAGAPICRVSAPTGAGLEELRSALREGARGIPVRPVRPPFRMAVDRVFTVAGRGTVVSGTVLRGTVAPGDALELLPERVDIRVREVQSHGVPLNAVGGGRRAALNLTGVDHHLIRRGSELATPGYLTPSKVLTVRLTCLPSAAHPLKSGQNVQLCMATGATRVRLAVLESRKLSPGEIGMVQFRSGQPICATYGQRFIIRDETGARTIGGGVVLRPVDRRGKDSERMHDSLNRLEHGPPEERVEEILRSAGFRTLSDLEICARGGVETSDLPAVMTSLERQGRWERFNGATQLVARSAVDDLRARMLTWLDRYHAAHPDIPGCPVDVFAGRLGRLSSASLVRPLLDRLVDGGDVRRVGRFVCRPAFAPILTASDERLLTTTIERIRGGAFQPPTLDELIDELKVDRKRMERLVSIAVSLESLVPIEPRLYLHSDWEADLRRRVADLVRTRGSSGDARPDPGVTVAEVRETLQSSRKYVVPFLEYLDRAGVTRRIGDRRVLADARDEPGLAGRPSAF